jgi:hypothetical protein
MARGTGEAPPARTHIDDLEFALAVADAAADRYESTRQEVSA